MRWLNATQSAQATKFACPNVVETSPPVKTLVHVAKIVLWGARDVIIHFVPSRHQQNHQRQKARPSRPRLQLRLARVHPSQLREQRAQQDLIQRLHQLPSHHRLRGH